MVCTCAQRSLCVRVSMCSCFLGDTFASLLIDSSGSAADVFYLIYMLAYLLPSKFRFVCPTYMSSVALGFFSAWRHLFLVWCPFLISFSHFAPKTLLWFPFFFPLRHRPSYRLSVCSHILDERSTACTTRARSTCHRCVPDPPKTALHCFASLQIIQAPPYLYLALRVYQSFKSHHSSTTLLFVALHTR